MLSLTAALWVVSLLVLAVGVVVFGRRIVGVIDRRSVSWTGAWLKTAVIVVALIGLVVVAPSFVLTLKPVSAMSRTAQEMIGTGVWTAGLGLGIAGLWWLHRRSRI